MLTQIAYNLGLALDHLGNAILLGNPDETISQRLARARNAGQKWAGIACGILTWISKTVFRTDRDHCTWSLTPGTDGAELWHWSKPED